MTGRVGRSEVNPRRLFDEATFIKAVRSGRVGARPLATVSRALTDPARVGCPNQRSRTWDVRRLNDGQIL
jgi:hypothetical protein